MDDLYAWTLAICLAVGNQTECDLDERFWVTSTELFRSDEECEAAWHEHIRRLNARPGWNGRVIVDTFLCGWGYPNPDPFYDLRAENLRSPVFTGNSAKSHRAEVVVKPPG